MFNASSGYKVSPGLPQPPDTLGEKEWKKEGKERGREGGREGRREGRREEENWNPEVESRLEDRGRSASEEQGSPVFLPRRP